MNETDQSTLFHRPAITCFALWETGRRAAKRSRIFSESGTSHFKFDIPPWKSYNFNMITGKYLKKCSFILLWAQTPPDTKNTLLIDSNFRERAWVRRASISIMANIAVIVAAIGTLIYVISTPKVGEKFTEFYILGEGGKAEGYPVPPGWEYPLKFLSSLPGGLR